NSILQRPRWKECDSDTYQPSYNKSPQSMSPALSQRHFDKVLCAGSNDPSKMQYSTNNCGSGSLLEKSYKDPLLLADGFYEWRRQEKDKRPFIYFPQTQGPAHVKTEDQDEGTPYKEDTQTCMSEEGSVNLEEVSRITNDFACVAGCQQFSEVKRWLVFGEVKSLDALKLLQSKNKLTFHPVSSLVNNSQNNSREPKPSAGSKMMGWLKSSTPSKRKEPDTGEVKQEGHTGETRPEKQPKTAGPRQQWLQEASKKPRTNID
uniref:Abasic site processing protein HMCES n=1 Tax=Salmo trutta TaxID=8032 RepID=A0A674DE63_SALTR